MPLIRESSLTSILNLAAKFAKDESPVKVNLGVGAYRDENGRPWVLPAVRLADNQLVKDPELNHEYQKVGGIPQLPLIHISEPTRPLSISYPVFCLKKKIKSFS